MSSAPRTAVPEVRARPMTTLRVGPMQGVQLSPNSTPSTGAPASPARGRTEGRMIRPVTGNRSNTPANRSPRMIVNPPRIWVSPATWVRRTEPSPPNATPSVANTAEKPSTNRAVPATVRGRPGLAAIVVAGAFTAVPPPLPPASGAGPLVPAVPPGPAALAVPATPLAAAVPLVPAGPGSAAVEEACASTPDMPATYDR